MAQTVARISSSNCVPCVRMAYDSPAGVRRRYPFPAAYVLRPALSRRSLTANLLIRRGGDKPQLVVDKCVSLHQTGPYARPICELRVAVRIPVGTLGFPKEEDEYGARRCAQFRYVRHELFFPLSLPTLPRLRTSSCPPLVARLLFLSRGPPFFSQTTAFFRTDAWTR